MLPHQNLALRIIEQAIEEARRDRYRYHVAQKTAGWTVKVFMDGNCIYYGNVSSGADAVLSALRFIDDSVDAAIAWLEGDDCKVLCEELGIGERHETITNWVRLGCPKPEDARRLKLEIMS